MFKRTIPLICQRSVVRMHTFLAYSSIAMCHLHRQAIYIGLWMNFNGVIIRTRENRIQLHWFPGVIQPNYYKRHKSHNLHSNWTMSYISWMWDLRLPASLKGLFFTPAKKKDPLMSWQRDPHQVLREKDMQNLSLNHCFVTRCIIYSLWSLQPVNNGSVLLFFLI